MFSGIIETTEKVKEFSVTDTGKRLVIEKNTAWPIVLGNSIAVQGACLTVADVNDTSLVFDLVPETLERTVFSKRKFEYVNIERARSIHEVMDGHITTGHIDTVGTIENITQDNGEYKLFISFDAQYASLVITKGSITIDGVSLTVVDVGKNNCSVVLVPYTREHTTLGQLTVGEYVNVEFDMIGKYINRFMETRYAGNR